MAARDVDALIGGSWRGSEDRIDVTNPADRTSVVARVPALSPSDIGDSYAAAADAFGAWRAMSAFDRASILRGAARLLLERKEEIAGDIVDENGKTINEATVEVVKSADFLDYYAGLDRDGYGTLINDVRPGTTTSFRREPLGVVLAITPWNDALLTPARKLAPALMCGNAVVLKPATVTPLAGIHLGRALHDAGVPPGVINVVTGRTGSISDALLDDERIAAVTFTGGNDVGRALRQRLAARNIRFQAELGGKNASVVLADADLDVAAANIVAASFGGAGQRCTATSRVIVDKAVAPAVLDRVLERVAGLRVGPGRDPASTVGPVVSASHRESVLGFVERAKDEGAAVLAGGSAPADETLAGGEYVLPTVLGDITPDMEIWRNEVFGPVIVVREVDGIDEAIAATNDSEYGLSAAVFTSNLTSSARFVDQVDCGQIAVNTSTSGWDVHIPFGGFKESGSPFKEQGVTAIDFYTKTKAVAVHAPGL